MTTHAFVEFRIPEADLFASLVGARNDLRSTMRLCDCMERQFDNNHPSIEVVDAFSTAILVRYCRAFPPGIRRWPWEAALDTLSAELKSRHDFFRQLRSKHIAHSVNALEEHRLQARYTLERFASEGITVITTASYTFAGLGSDDVTTIRTLSASILEFVEEALLIEQVRLLQVVRAMTLDQLRATISPLSPHDFDRAHTPRERP